MNIPMFVSRTGLLPLAIAVTSMGVAVRVTAAEMPVLPSVPMSLHLAQTSPSALAQTYADPDGLFQISLPADYAYEETGTGILFVSSNGEFGGMVDYGSAQGNQFTPEALELALKQEYEARIPEVTWQRTSLQPNGSVRIDWFGTDEQGNDIDAISFVAQSGDRIFILNLWGVNVSYSRYNADATAIANSYRIYSPESASP